MKSYPDAIADLAGPWGPYENRESWLGTAATRSGLSYRTIKGLFYGEITDPPTSVTRKLEAALGYSLTASQEAGNAQLARLEARFAEFERRVARLGGEGLPDCPRPHDLSAGAGVPAHRAHLRGAR